MRIKASTFTIRIGGEVLYSGKSNDGVEFDVLEHETSPFWRPDVIDAEGVTVDEPATGSAALAKAGAR